MEVDALLLKAAADLLVEGGYAALSFEALSQRTGVTRATIYRRWPSKAHLASQLVNQSGAGAGHWAGKPDFALRIRAFVQDVCRQYDAPAVAPAVVGLVSTYRKNPRLRDVLHTPLEAGTREALRDVFEQARKKGEVRGDADADIVFDLVVGAIIFRSLLSTFPMNDAFVDSLVATVMNGVLAQ